MKLRFLLGFMLIVGLGFVYYRQQQPYMNTTQSIFGPSDDSKISNRSADKMFSQSVSKSIRNNLTGGALIHDDSSDKEIDKIKQEKLDEIKTIYRKKTTEKKPSSYRPITTDTYTLRKLGPSLFSLHLENQAVFLDKQDESTWTKITLSFVLNSQEYLFTYDKPVSGAQKFKISAGRFKTVNGQKFEKEKLNKVVAVKVEITSPEKTRLGTFTLEQPS